MNIAMLIGEKEINARMKQWLEEYCRLYGREAAVREYSTEEELLDAAAGDRPELVFIGLTGPEGFLRARSIREKLAGPKMIFITDRKDFAVQCLHLHFTDYIVGNVEFKEFVRAMKLAGVGA